MIGAVWKQEEGKWSNRYMWKVTEMTIRRINGAIKINRGNICYNTSILWEQGEGRWCNGDDIWISVCETSTMLFYWIKRKIEFVRH